MSSESIVTIHKRPCIQQTISIFSLSTAAASPEEGSLRRAGDATPDSRIRRHLALIYMHWAYKEDVLPPLLHAQLRLLDRALTDAVAVAVSRVQAVIMRDFKRIPSATYVCPKLTISAPLQSPKGIHVIIDRS